MDFIKAIFFGLACTFAASSCLSDDTTNLEEHIESFKNEGFDMFDLMTRYSSSDEEPLNFSLASRASTLIVIGHIRRVHDGQKYRHIDEHPNMPPLVTVIFEVEVANVLKGQAVDNTVYFEFLAGGVPTEVYDELKYEDEVMLFLKRPSWDLEKYEVSELPDYLREDIGSNLYALTSRSGFFVEIDKHIEAPIVESSPILLDPDFSIERLRDAEETWKERFEQEQ